jgi:multidrug efflux system outer membrane protein
MTTLRMQRTVTTIALAAVLAAACTVGPDYKRPPVILPDQYRGVSLQATDGGETPSVADRKWWELFQDEQLQILITTALQQNFDVRVAATRILQAEAQLGIVRADQFPTVNGDQHTASQRRDGVGD